MCLDGIWSTHEYGFLTAYTVQESYLQLIPMSNTLQNGRELFFLEFQSKRNPAMV